MLYDELKKVVPHPTHTHVYIQKKEDVLWTSVCCEVGEHFSSSLALLRKGTTCSK